MDTLTTIYQNPSKIISIKSSQLRDIFYLYGLKRLVSVDMDKAIKLWEYAKQRHILNEEQHQAFIAHVALYKAMRNNPDALVWFKKMKPQYYTDLLVDWQIRFALTRHDWKHVAEFINKSANKESPCWQYWLARAQEKQGKNSRSANYLPLFS